MPSLSDLSSKQKALLADAAILFSAILWGGDYVFAKHALEVIPPGLLNAVRFSICALILLIFVRKRLAKLNGKEIAIAVLTGTMMFGGFAGQTAGLIHTSVANNAFLTSAYVIMVPFIAWALTRVRPGGNSFLGVFLCTAGIGFLTLQGGLSLSQGDAITILGAFFFAVELSLLGIYAKRIDPLALAFLEAATVAILSWIFTLLFETPPAAVDGKTLLSMAYITFFGAVITHIIVTIALKYTSSSHGAVLCSTEAGFGALLAALILREGLNGRSLLGCGLILLAVLVTELGEGLFKGRKMSAVKDP